MIAGVALRSDPVRTGHTYAVLLGGMAFAFFLRVLGQALVAAGQAGFLPPMEAWYSCRREPEAIG